MVRYYTFISVLSIAIIICSLVSSVFLVSSRRVTVEKIPVVGDPTIKVSVLNGCGREGIASLFVERLRAKGFDVVNGMGENADSFDFDQSVVVDRKGMTAKAQMVADALGVTIILKQRTSNPYAIEDVAFIIGRDWDTISKQKEE